ncbi:hypothetical protein [Halocatena pleomorpha]|uniref:Uncharacterized protein n=1 Tax=Halocatena pleomorpha TaxID=1785090 RepID=A0A3P3RKW5_9EURY|nr:hypothetical protein [Halocatena pleomorpha]RRJ34005.1 hypothetical protein EIK79_00325 [Halocatena pleomorpha]
MMATLIALSQRNEAFWISLVLILLGGITPEIPFLGEIEPSGILIWIGAGILLIRVLVAAVRIFKTAAEAGVIGYREGKRNDS